MNYVIILVSIFLITNFYKTDYKPNLQLNHVYITLDSQTIEALNKSEFLSKNFAYFVKKETANSKGEKWKASYIFGQSIYIELFEKSVDLNNNSRVGVAFGFDREHEHTQFSQLLIKEFDKTHFVRIGDLVRRSDQTPWFWVTEFTSLNNKSAYFWTMEYHKEALPSKKSISRIEYNESKYRSDLLLNNISELDISLNDEAQSVLERILLLGGFKKTEEGLLKVYKNDEVTFKVLNSNNSNSDITRIVFKLNKINVGDLEYKIGLTKLFFSKDKQEAIWEL